MPTSTQPQDTRVRSPISSVQDPFEQFHFNDAPQRHQQQVLTRPALNRNVASHISTTSAISAYSTGTDGSYLQSEDGSAGFPDFGDNIDSATFEQILEMDEDEDEREFSKSIVYDFFTQAQVTFQKMDSALEGKDLDTLSTLGHFLKGSSATLGLTKVKDSCEKIQHLGAHMDETGQHDEPNDDTCLEKCKVIVERAKREFAEVEVALKHFFRDQGD